MVQVSKVEKIEIKICKNTNEIKKRNISAAHKIIKKRESDIS